MSALPTRFCQSFRSVTRVAASSFSRSPIFPSCHSAFSRRCQPVQSVAGSALLEAVLADVHLRVDVAEGLRDRLRALPADAGGGVRLLRGLQVTGLDGLRERLGLRQGLVGLRLHVLAVGGHGLVEPGVALGRLAAGGLHVLADALALHAGLAGDPVVAGLHLGGDPLLGAGADVLPLGDHPVVGEEEIDLGDLGTLVLYGQFDVPGRELRLRDLARVVRRRHRDDVLAVLGTALLRAARDGGQGRDGGDGGDGGESGGSHAGLQGMAEKCA